MTVDARQALFDEMRRLIEAQLAEFDDSLSSSAARSNWLGPRGDCLKEAPCREALRSMLKTRLASICLDLAAAFDGASAMSDHGQPLYLTDAAGQRLSSDLCLDLTGYFEDHLY